MKIKKKYLAPTLKWYYYQPEVGFAGSIIINPSNPGSGYNNGQQEWHDDAGTGFDDGGGSGGSGDDGGWDWD